jgi:hypothetical protein
LKEWAAWVATGTVNGKERFIVHLNESLRVYLGI